MATQRLREYELVVVLTPEASEDEAAVSVDRVAGFIAGRGGTISVRENWGVRRLAYPIQDYREGNYFLMRFELDAGEARELEDTLQTSQDVLRHLVTIAEGPRPKPVEEKVEEPTATAEVKAEEPPAAAGDPVDSDPPATEESPGTEADTPAAVESGEGAPAADTPEAEDKPGD